MTKFKSQGVFNTFKNARKGIRIVLKSEMNIRVHFVIAFLVLISAVILKINYLEICLLMLTIAFVIVTEMLNTSIEFALDSIFHNRFSRLVGMAKDIAAGSVLLATIVAIAVGVIIFSQAIIKLFI